MTTWSSRMRTSTGFKETSSSSSVVVFLNFPILPCPGSSISGGMDDEEDSGGDNMWRTSLLMMVC